MPLVDAAGYADAALLWFAAGWAPLPIPAGQKLPPPSGFTGDSGIYPDEAQVVAWCSSWATGNLALRLPPGVVGIDVDEYQGEHVVDHLIALEARLGKLPATWASSSQRADGSGIWLYRLPAPMVLHDKPVPGIDVIQRHHRYVVTWPSRHPEGRDYMLWHPDGSAATYLPTPADLTPLPAAWVEYLSISTPIALPASPSEPGSSTAIKLSTGADRWVDAVEQDFNQRTTWQQVLTQNGWQHHHSGAAIDYWTRPGKELSQGWSATTNAKGTDTFIVHTTSTDFETTSPSGIATSYNRFGAYAVLRFAGDRLAAARWLRQQGYGPPEPARTTQSTSALPKAPEGLQAPPEAVFLPAEWWEARPELAHIKQAAHHRNRAADAVLHSCLARLSAMVPFTIELPPIVGAAGSLNYFCAVVGPSGIGKSTSVAIASNLLPAGIATRAGMTLVDDKPLGSGEGLAEVFMGTISITDEEGKAKRVRGQEFHQAFVYVDEGDTIAAQSDRKGTTLLETMRRAWSGQTLGQSNATAERTRVIRQGSYRLAMVVGFQPERAGRLLADEIGGTPQRFIFAAAIDPGIPDTAPQWPGPLLWAPPDAGQLQSYTTLDDSWVRHQMQVHSAITSEVRARDLAKARGDTSGAALDAHGDLHRLKLAGLLAILDERMSITQDDWELATVAWRTSCAVRAWVLEAVAADTERSEVGQIEKAVRREVTVGLARNDAQGAVVRVARRMSTWVHEQQSAEGHTMRELNMGTSSRDRAVVEFAIDYALRAEWLVLDKDRFKAGTAKPA